MFAVCAAGGPAWLAFQSTLRLERTTDTGLIRSIIGHPEIKPQVIEGDDVPVPLHDSIYHLLVRDTRYADGAVEDALLGIVSFLPINNVSWNPHIAILPAHRGCGTEAMKAAMAWMFANTPCVKLVAYPPAFKGAMIRVFEKCGFRLEGCSPKSFLWKGELHARLLYGFEKETV